RKLLCHPGWYVKNGRLVHNELTFWGEWEPQSRITRIDNPIEDKCSPHVIHRPLLDLSEPKTDARGCRQNTDPFVFHDRFLYRCCKQINAKGPTRLAHLLPGSIVLFGSKVNERFVIDTVFVVGDFRDYYDKKGGMDFDPNLKKYAEIVGVGLKSSGHGNCSGCGNNPSQMRLYYGATPDNRCEGMYSFVPCKRLSDDEKGWARPILTQDDMRDIYANCITDNFSQGVKYCREATLEGNVAAWNRIRKLFADRGYLEGVKFECPQDCKI
ncbi:MAG: hypothetical protein IJT08_01110, partial [Alphaproteobacteria bacterium]|nr:hypothetical protein [Alphaproteobacteria bacterium]